MIILRQKNYSKVSDFIIKASGFNDPRFAEYKPPKPGETAKKLKKWFKTKTSKNLVPALVKV